MVFFEWCGLDDETNSCLKKWWFPIGISWTPGVDFQGLYMLVSGRVKEPPFGMMLMYVDA